MTLSTTSPHDRFDLAAEPSAVRCARHHAAHVLTGWCVPTEARDDALLIVSELISNAIHHARTPPEEAQRGARAHSHGCTLNLRLMPDHLLVYVYDRDSRPPVLRPSSDDEERGRGLRLVEALSASWGYTPTTRAPGKVVWAKIARQAPRRAPTPLYLSQEEAGRPRTPGGPRFESGQGDVHELNGRPTGEPETPTPRRCR